MKKTDVKYRTRCFKNSFQKIPHKAAEIKYKFIGNKTAEGVAKLNDVINVKKQNLQLMKVQEMLKK